MKDGRLTALHYVERLRESSMMIAALGSSRWFPRSPTLELKQRAESRFLEELHIGALYARQVIALAKKHGWLTEQELELHDISAWELKAREHRDTYFPLWDLCSRILHASRIDLEEWYEPSAPGEPPEIAFGAFRLQSDHDERDGVTRTFYAQEVAGRFARLAFQVEVKAQWHSPDPHADE